MSKSLKISDGISVIMPTYKRPEGLKIALTSLLEQQTSALALEIIIADNDPAGSAKPYVERIAKAAKTPIVYLHVPQPGVSNARNGALAIAQGRYIAWLDDDQDAAPNWINAMLTACESLQASLVFCPTHARIPNADKYEKFYYNFFSRFGPEIEEGVIEVK